jgi:tRNA-splicing ligase RtcB
MASKSDFQRVGKYTWELPKGHREDMRVPVRVFADAELFDAAFRDRTVEQLINTATLPGIVKYAMALPDMHQGYGFPIGGVAGIDADAGVISPGGVGYDINCGVRLLASHLDQEEVEPFREDLMTALFQSCPSGLGGDGRVRVNKRQLDQLLTEGASWALKQGLAPREDVEQPREGARPDSGRLIGLGQPLPGA